MTHYSRRSITRLLTCHQDFQVLMFEVDNFWPNTILEGKRTIEQQRENVRTGVSKTLDSRHLDDPAEALDAAPDPLSWPHMDAKLAELLDHLPAQERHEMEKLVLDYAKQLARWYYFGGFVLGTAEQLRKRGMISHRIRHGADWNGDRGIHDQRFDDLPHFELRD
jgi:hypothetical protein